MNYSTLEPRVPQNIVLSFSGGGFRAASYALGCLSYMEHLKIGEGKLTDLIRFSASASGGSFINLAYALYRKTDETFPVFYERIKTEVLTDEKIGEKVFEILQSDSYWKDVPEKSKNMINAFAIAYDELIFKGAQFGILNSKVVGDGLFLPA